MHLIKIKATRHKGNEASRHRGTTKPLNNSTPQLLFVLILACLCWLPAAAQFTQPSTGAYKVQPMQYYANKPVAPRVQLCLLLDPMLATGGSAAATCTILKDWGVNRIKYIGLIAAPEGIARLQAAHPDVDIHVGAIDSHLNDIGYTVPGLGDAGDRQFGPG